MKTGLKNSKRSWLGVGILLSIGGILLWENLDSARLEPQATQDLQSFPPDSQNPPPESQQAQAEDADESELATHLREGGWKEVRGIAPDLEVVELNPSALLNKEAQLQQQIRTNSYSGPDLKKLRSLLAEASGEKTRFIALEALGRSTDPKAKSILIELYADLATNRERTLALTYLTPKGISGSTANFLFSVARDTDAAPNLRQLAVSNLTLASMVEQQSNRPGQTGVHPSLIRRLPEGMLGQAQKIVAQIERGVQPHPHHEDTN